MSNVLLTDGQGTPVVHTFTPNNGQMGDKPATWYNKAAGTTLRLWERLESFVQLAKPGGQHRSTTRLILPREYTEGSVTKTGELRGFITVQADEQVGTTANLNDLLTMMRDLIDEAITTSTHKDLNVQG
jgi:hypothetical protein